MSGKYIIFVPDVELFRYSHGKDKVWLWGFEIQSPRLQQPWKSAPRTPCCKFLAMQLILALYFLGQNYA